MSVLNIQKISKTYANFKLKDVSFNLEKGYIMGFIGVNGAGKTTTLKSILNMIHIESGNISVFNMDSEKDELQIKQNIGCMFGGIDFYPKRKIKCIKDVVKRFYDNWDEEVYRKYLKYFNLDEEKKVCELSNGMKVKFNLVLALSHGAKLFIFDEPTTGLDPAARDDVLEIFQEIIEDGEKSIIFSTHIVSDLEKCADYITYIDNGEIIASTLKDEFIDSYRIVKGSKKVLERVKNYLISHKENSFGFMGLIKFENINKNEEYEIFEADLEDIMIYYAKRGASDERIIV